MKPPEFWKPRRNENRPSYTNDQLKDLLKKAWEAEVIKKEKELSRPLKEEEKSEIKITKEFLNNQYKAGLIPSPTTFIEHFGSIVNLANLTELPRTKRKENESYYEAEKSNYIKILKAYIEEFRKRNGRNPNRTEIRNAKIDGIPSTLLNKDKDFDVFNILGIDKATRGSTEKTFSDEDLISSVEKAFEKKFQLEAHKLGKDNLTPEERKKVRLTIKDYNSLKEKDDPSSISMVRRFGREFGPSWDDALKKAGLLPE